MNVGGSQQLRLFRRLFHLDGMPIEQAAALAEMSLGEALLHAEADAANPPPPEAFEILSTPPANSRGPEAQSQENDMARTARKPKDDDEGGVIHAKDFDKAISLFKNDIKPAQAKVGEHAQEQSTAFKAIKKLCHIQPAAAKAAFKLFDMEDAKREDWLRAFNGLIEKLGIGIKPDLVDQMQSGENKGPAPVQSNRPRPTLVTVPQSDGTETDLADAANDLPTGTAEPKRRGRPKAAPAPGTGAAAIAAMNAANKGDDDDEDEG